MDTNSLSEHSEDTSTSEAYTSIGEEEDVLEGGQTNDGNGIRNSSSSAVVEMSELIAGVETGEGGSDNGSEKIILVERTKQEDGNKSERTTYQPPTSLSNNDAGHSKTKRVFSSTQSRQRPSTAYARQSAISKTKGTASGSKRHQSFNRPSTAKENRRSHRPVTAGRRVRMPRQRPSSAVDMNSIHQPRQMHVRGETMWGMFSLLCPLNPHIKGVGVPIRIPETIFFTDNGTFVSWFTNDRRGLVRKRPSSMLTRHHIKSKLTTCRERRAGSYHPMSVLRRKSSADLVDTRGLELFFCDLQEHSSQGGKGPGENDDCVVAIQEFVPAYNDTRYIVVFINDPSTARAACETFALRYSNEATDLSSKTLNMERMIGRVPRPKPRVEPTKDEKISDDLRRKVMQITNYINKRSIQGKLDALVCEFVIDESEVAKRKRVEGLRMSDYAVMIGIIGTKWRGAVPSWVKAKGRNPTADLLCTLVPRIDYKASKAPGQKLPRGFGSHHAVGINGHQQTRVTRILGPKILAGMARELDEYHNTLGSEIQRSQTAQKRLEKVSTELTEAKEQSDGLASQLLKTAREMNESAQSCREMKERCGVLTQRNRDLEQQYTDNNNVIQDLRTTVQAERETSFKILTSMQNNIDSLSNAKTENEARISELENRNREAEQVRKEQNEQIEALRRQLLEYSERLNDTAATLRDTRDVLSMTRKERDHYRRFLPQDDNDGSKKKPPYNLHIQDLLHDHDEKMEMWMLTQYIYEIQASLEEQFYHYVSHSHDDNEPLLHDHGFHHFLKDAGCITEDFPVAEADILMQKAHARGGRRPQYNNKYNLHDFAEAIIRISHHKHCQEEEYLTECLRMFVETHIKSFNH